MVFLLTLPTLLVPLLLLLLLLLPLLPLAALPAPGFSFALATAAVLSALANSPPGISLVLAPFVAALRAVLSLMGQD